MKERKQGWDVYADEEYKNYGENNPTQPELTASDREYAQRNGISSSDMLVFKEDIMIEEEKWQADQWQKQQRLQWLNFKEEQKQVD